MEAPCRASGHTFASGEGSLASPYAVVGRRISGDYGEARLLLPAKPGKGGFRLKKADRAGDAVDSPGVI